MNEMWNAVNSAWETADRDTLAHATDGYVRPRKVSYAVDWMYFLMGICLFMAWYFPINLVVKRLLWPPAARGVRDAHTFAVLAYEGVSRKLGEIEPARLREHVRKLKENGYHPVHMREIVDLYRDNQPLPRNAVLLTFDQSRKSSYFNVKPILRQMGWNAVMFLWIKPMRDHDQASLLWPYVRAMLKSRRWEIGAQSYDGFHKVPLGNDKHAHAMTSPQWLANENRYETVREYQQRLAGDHQACIAAIRKYTGQKPMAYAYPYGDFGQFNAHAVLPRLLNLALVENNYDLGFLTGNLALNTRHSDPRRLNRLLVPPYWSGRELVDHLQQAWPSPSTEVSSENVINPSAWIVNWGRMHTMRDRICLMAPDTITGAKIWLAGSDLCRNYHARLRFYLRQGQMGIYLRATPDSESYVYLGLDDGASDTPAGNSDDIVQSGIWVRQKHIGSDRFTLAAAQTSIDLASEHILEVYLRDHILYATLDGQRLFAEQIALRGQLKPGMFGLSIWHPQKGQANLELTGLDLRSMRPVLAQWENTDGESHVFDWINRNAYRITSISPEWRSYRTLENGRMHHFDARTYRLLARINSLQLIPQLIVNYPNVLHMLAPEHLADQLATMNADGMFINLGDLHDARMKDIASWLIQSGRILGDRGMAFILRMPSALESFAAVHPILDKVPGATFAVPADSALWQERAIPENRLMLVKDIPKKKEGSADLLYHMISNLPTDREFETTEAKRLRLERQGWTAFNENEYKKAVEAWKQWLEIDANNARALMLIGDAHLRLADKTEALSFYNKSLEIDPGQIALVIRRAELLTDLGHEDQARDSLNLYSRLFPGDVRISMAQTRWLLQQRRYEEAGTIVKKMLMLAPDNIEIRGMALRIFEPRDDLYRQTMRKLETLGSKAIHHAALIKTIWNYEILAMPYSQKLRRIVHHIAEMTRQPSELLIRIAPTDRVTREDFSQPVISNDWITGGGVYTNQQNVCSLSVAPGNTEARITLAGSMHYNNAYIEATVSDIRGNCWLYARRTAEHNVRFGIDQEGLLRLQVWRKGALLRQETIPREWNGHPVTLRLEVNAAGAIGYVDQVPAVKSKLFVPETVAYGWTGLAVHHPTRSNAGMRIHRIKSGPLPFHAAIVQPPEQTEQPIDEKIGELLAENKKLTAITPLWGSVDQNGKWTESENSNLKLLRLFSRYYRIWFLPIARIDLTATIPPVEVLRAQARAAQADGFILLTPTWPPDEYLKALDEQLENEQLKIVVGKESAGLMKVRGLGAGQDLFPPDAPVYEIPMVQNTNRTSEVFQTTYEGDAFVIY